MACHEVTFTLTVYVSVQYVILQAPDSSLMFISLLTSAVITLIIIIYH